GNQASFVQILSVDTVAPAIAITGGAAATTTALTPTLAGTSDAAPGTTVTVAIGGQTMTTLLQPNGTWNATPSALAEGAWPVSASVQDPAGNTGTAGQTLTIQSGAPAVPLGSEPAGAILLPAAPPVPAAPLPAGALAVRDP